MKPIMFLIHFAGGSRYSYQPLVEHLPAFHVICLELPGRGKRGAEPLLTDSEAAAKDLLGQILKVPFLADYAIYGHSLGAILGFKVAALLTQLRLPPACLIVSGNPGPGIGHTRGRLFDLPKAALIEAVKRLGGTSDLLFQDPAVFDYFEPILRADFQMAEAGAFDGAEALPIPLFAAMGDREEGSDQVDNWRNYTTAAFRSKLFAGHHFFINDHVAGLGQFITDAYDYSKSKSYR